MPEYQLQREKEMLQQLEDLRLRIEPYEVVSSQFIHLSHANDVLLLIFFVLGFFVNVYFVRRVRDNVVVDALHPTSPV